MSVLIKGMEMPTRCEECPFCLNCPPACGVTGFRVLGHGKARLDNCPLTEIPPHGRLIDADALKADGFDSNGKMYIANSQIFDAPTIIDAEE